MKKQTEKQAIEEMAKDLCIPVMRFLPWVNCEMCENNGTDIEQCLFHKYAKILTKAGYRKQSEGEWEFVEKEAFWICNMEESLKTGKPTKELMPVCSVCKTLFGKIVLEFKFCPNCGAKMKGGAE